MSAIAVAGLSMWASRPRLRYVASTARSWISCSRPIGGGGGVDEAGLVTDHDNRHIACERRGSCECAREATRDDKWVLPFVAHLDSISNSRADICLHVSEQ